MSLATVIGVIASAMGAQTGLAIADQVAPGKFTSPTLKAKLEYRITSCVTVGDADRVYTYDDDADTLVETIQGSNRFTLTVECEGYSSDPTRNALYYLDKIEKRLNFQTVVDAFNAAGISWIDSLSYVDLPRTHDDRVFSRGAKDFIFLASYVEAHDPGDPGESYIAEVDLVSQYLYDSPGHATGVQIDLQVIAP